MVLHYIWRRIAEVHVLVELAGTIGLDRGGFAVALDKVQGDATLAHIQEIRRLAEPAGGFDQGGVSIRSIAPKTFAIR